MQKAYNKRILLLILSNKNISEQKYIGKIVEAYY